jgi:PhnB protein
MSPKSRKGDAVQVQPYLDFNGRCEEAIEFYRRALGAEVTSLHRFKDSPDPNMQSPAIAEKIMHANLRIGENSVLASDGGGSYDGQLNFQGFLLSLNVSNVAEGERLFAALSEGGQVMMPLTKTFFSPGFGMLTDRFSVRWMVHVAH